MPTFYFNVRSDEFDATDLVGEYCRSAKEVRRQALRAAQSIVQQELMNGGMLGDGWIDVEDEEHRPVLSIPLRDAAS